MGYLTVSGNTVFYLQSTPGLFWCSIFTHISVLTLNVYWNVFHSDFPPMDFSSGGIGAKECSPCLL